MSPADTVSAELVGYNHTDRYIGAFYVNGRGGSNIFEHSGGGKFVCCVELPKPWHPGYTVTVKWEDQDEKVHTRDVPVPEYRPEKAGLFGVHFLRDGSIRVFASDMILNAPEYPLKGKDAELTPGVPVEIFR